MDRSFEKSFAMDAKIGAGAEMIDLGGTIDPATGEMTIKMGGAEPLELIITREAVYMKQDEPDRKPWVRLDRSRLKADGPLGQAIDVRSQAGILAGVVSAESVGGGKYTGTADLAKAVAAADNESQKQSLEQAAKVVKNGSAVPFEATLDGEGRLTDLSYVFDTPAGEITTELAFHSFGEPVAIEPPPAAETEEAPEELYMFF